MTAKQITLNVRAVALAAKAAHERGKLTAQAPEPACVYRMAGGFGCAIGAALTYREAQWLVAGQACGMSTHLSVLGGRFTTDNLAELCRLQRAHDRWCRSRTGDEDGDPIAAEEEFLTMLEAHLGDAAVTVPEGVGLGNSGTNP